MAISAAVASATVEGAAREYAPASGIYVIDQNLSYTKKAVLCILSE